MRAGNVSYVGPSDIPEIVPVFPLSAALLLPGGQMPLNIFEPRYLAMIDHAIGAHRMIGMIQPSLDAGGDALCAVGCLGRIVSFSETGDGRYLVTLAGVCRFRLVEEVAARAPWRQARIAPLLADLDAPDGDQVDRQSLLGAFRAFLAAHNMEADWDSVNRADNVTLVNALAMMSPYGAAEKQALLEAVDLKARAETLVAITEILLARDGENGSTLQ